MQAARWSKDRIDDWRRRTGWLLGCNYLPSYAVNFIEFWQRDRFDPRAIAAELQLAASTGLNSLRVNLSYVNWKHEGDRHLQNADRFLELAAQAGLRVVLTPFDDCQFSGHPTEYGRQPDPLPGVHNSRANGSPGRERVLEWAADPSIEAYFKTVVERYRDDRRIVYWDLYNEPGNRMEFGAGESREFDPALEQKSLELLQKCFRWARAIDPVQPLSVAAWRVGDQRAGEAPYDNAIDRYALEHSDLISMHAYVPLERIQRLIEFAAQFDRPIVVSEWLGRAVGSRVEQQLPLLAENSIGSFHWGLVNGRTQTHLPWPFLDVDSKEWFHDLYRADHSAWDPAEIAVFIDMANKYTHSPA